MGDTEYLLAGNAQDYTKSRRFFRENGIEVSKLTFPTVFAKRHGQVVAVLSTLPIKDAIVAGPLHIDVEGNPSFVFMRLVDAYDGVMQKLGITGYTFYTKKDDTKYLKAIRAMEVKELYTDENDRVWFERIF